MHVSICIDTKNLQKLLNNTIKVIIIITVIIEKNCYKMVVRPCLQVRGSMKLSL